MRIKISFLVVLFLGFISTRSYAQEDVTNRFLQKMNSLYAPDKSFEYIFKLELYDSAMTEKKSETIGKFSYSKKRTIIESDNSIIIFSDSSLVYIFNDKKEIFVKNIKERSNKKQGILEILESFKKQNLKVVLLDSSLDAPKYAICTRDTTPICSQEIELGKDGYIKKINQRRAEISRGGKTYEVVYVMTIDQYIFNRESKKLEIFSYTKDGKKILKDTYKEYKYTEL
jgi:hypothetical protein